MSRHHRRKFNKKQLVERQHLSLQHLLLRVGLKRHPLAVNEIPTGVKSDLLLQHRFYITAL